MSYDTNREHIGLMREAAAKIEQEKRRKSLARKVGIVALTATLSQLWWAQLLVWGLSLFHVSTGYWGPFIMLEVFGSVTSTAVCLGMVMTAKRMSED